MQTKCLHHNQTTFDISGRSCCSLCGEVLTSVSDYQEVAYPLSAEFHQVPSLSSFGTDFSTSSSALINSVGQACEKDIGLTFSAEIKQRIMQLVVLYRNTLEGKSLTSYENVTRAAIAVVLRQLGYYSDNKLDFLHCDKKRQIQVLRVMTRMTSALGINPMHSSIDPISFISQKAERMISGLAQVGVNATVGLSSETPLQLISLTANSLRQLAAEFCRSSTDHILEMQLIACVAVSVMYACEFVDRSPTFKECLSTLHISRSNKPYYKHFRELKTLLLEMRSLLCIASNYKESEAIRMVLENLPDGILKLREKYRINQKIQVIGK